MMPPAPCPVVDSQHAWTLRWISPCHASQLTEQCRGAGQDAKLPGQASREPAFQPNAKAIFSMEELKRQVRRAYQLTVLGRRSMNIRCSHPSVSQKKRRTWSRIRTGIPPKEDRSADANSGYALEPMAGGSGDRYSALCKPATSSQASRVLPPSRTPEQLLRHLEPTFLFHDKLPWDCQNLIFLPPNRLLGKYQLGFTKSAEEPKSS